MRNSLCFLLIFVAAHALAQGNFLYTWHGNQNLFQAAFQVPPSENQPGAYFEGGTFRSTFTVTSPDAAYPPNTFASGEDASGFGPPLQLSVIMRNSSTGTGILVSSAGTDFYFISEYLLSAPSVITWREQGHWTSAQIPEPSAATIAVLGLAALICRKLPRAILRFRLPS